MPSKLKLTSKIAPNALQVNTLKVACFDSTGPKLSDPIDKNASSLSTTFHAKNAESKKGSPSLKKASQLPNLRDIPPFHNSSVDAR